MEEHAAEWLKMLQIPDSYQYQKTIELICKYEFEKFDAELYRQANGPDTFQRVLKVFPKNCSRPLPAVAVPFYRPEKMIGFELDTGEILQNCIGIAMMAHLAQRGFIAASADAYHLTYVKSDLDREDFSRWKDCGEALTRDYPEWCGMGKLLADTRLLIDTLDSDPRVDSSRIGIAGHSLGGKMAFYAGCLDPRIKAILASDFGIGWDQTNWNDIWYWGDRVEKLKKAGLEHSQLLTMSGGKPFFLLAGKYDNEESRKIMLRAHGYESHPEYLGFLNHATGHRPPPDALAAGYDFLERHLKLNCNTKNRSRF